MALFSEWNAFRPGIIFGCVGVVMAIIVLSFVLSGSVYLSLAADMTKICIKNKRLKCYKCSYITKEIWVL